MKVTGSHIIKNMEANKRTTRLMINCPLIILGHDSFSRLITRPPVTVPPAPAGIVIRPVGKINNNNNK